MSRGETLVVLAAGRSSRMKRTAEELRGRDAEQARDLPKCLIAVGPRGEPLLDLILASARAAGLTDAVIVTGPEAEAIRARYGTREAGNEFQESTVSYAVQPAPVGTADALLQALDQRPEIAGGPVLVVNSDNLYSERALGLLCSARAPNAFPAYDRDGLGLPPERVAGYAVVKLDASGALLDLVEKPDAATIERFRQPDGRLLVSMNVWRLTPSMIRPFLESTPPHPVRGERELPVAVLAMARALSGSVVGVPISEAVPDLSSAGDIAKVREFLARAASQRPPGQ